MMGTLHEQAKLFVRELRKRQTASEAVMWSKLRNRRFHGKKFLRQHPIYYDREDKEAFYIADFYCHEHRLVVEVDGAIHRFHQNNDAIRTENLELKGYRVIRCRNEDVERDLAGVLKAIEESFNLAPSPPSLPKRRGPGACLPQRQCRQG